MMTDRGVGRVVVPVPLWTHEETAAYLRVGSLLLTQLVTAGAGPTCYRVGRHRRYDRADVRAWLSATATRRCPGRHEAPPCPGPLRTPLVGAGSAVGEP